MTRLAYFPTHPILFGMLVLVRPMYSLKKYEDIPLFDNLCFVFVWMLDTRFKDE